MFIRNLIAVAAGVSALAVAMPAGAVTLATPIDTNNSQERDHV